MNRQSNSRRIAAAVILTAAAVVILRLFTRDSGEPHLLPVSQIEPVSPIRAALAASAGAAPRTAEEKSPVLADPGSTAGGFQSWAQRYLAASSAGRRALEAEGVRLAAARRVEFRQLIIDDPREALRQAVPMVVRQELPESVLGLLEERLNGVAVLRVIQGVPAEGEPRPTGSLTFREAEFKDGKTYRAYVYGRRVETLTWTAGASLNGVAIDSSFAVNEDPLRRLEVGERPPESKSAVTLCPVSGNKTEGGDLQPGDTITDQTPAVETATEIVYFCDAVHIDHYTRTLVMGEGVSGGAFGFTGILPAAPTPALGVVKVLAIPMTYADQNAVPSTEAALYATLRDVGDFYSKSSFGRLTLVGVVCPPVKLKHNEAWYVNRDTSNGGDISGTSVEHAESREEARKLGFDSSDYDCVVVRHTGGPGSYGGLGGGSSVWARSDSASLWAHEIGHCFALAHANFWDTAGTSSIGAGANQEYGDSYDNMGGAPFPAGQYNAQAKSQIKWMPSNFVENVTQSGIYRIHAMDQGVLIPSRRYAMTVVKDVQRTYWGEVRSLFDSNPWVRNGMLLGWRYPGGSGNNLQLIDTTPGSPFLKEDAPISLGNTFSDLEAGIHLTTIATNDSPRYMDVVVNFGQFPTNNRPSLALSASADVVPVGATVTFTAVAGDPDGDALAFAWQHFGDSAVKIVSPNAPVITRTFSSAGTYIVTCTASDMKGGTTTRNQLVTVGNGNGRSTISGRVTFLGLGLQDVAVTANGANGVVTDADGYFTIPNLTNNTYTMTPLLYGFTFGELFNNSVPVAPNFDGANFEATALPVVTIAATVSNANELAPVTAGRFTITRTGDISQDLVVNVNTASGSATKTTDYTFSPDYTTGSQGFSNFMILADSATLDVIVTPVTDTAQEGPETVVLQLGPGTGYLVGPQSSATVAIDDDDTTLPKISVRPTTPNATEDGGQPAVFTFARTGATTSNLTVNYVSGGTAASGGDYVALSGSVVIPIGSTSAVVNVTPVNDSVSEPLEIVRLTPSANAAYIIDPLASNAVVNIIDDDVQTVTVVATDPAAREVDLTQPAAVADTGTFVISRSGDLSNPLTVYYAMAGTPGGGVTALHGVDYEALPGVLVIPAGASNASVTILPRFDGFGEGPESVVLTLGAGSTSYILGSPGSATLTINDSTNDAPYIDVVNISSASEPSTSGTFRITARGGTNAGTLTLFYTVSGSAMAGADYNISGLDTNTLMGSTNITLASGATVTRDIVVAPINDALLEDRETVILTITSNAAYRTYPATTAATMWLRDDDQPTVYADTQVGSGSAITATIAEGAATSPVKFYISRTGSTAGALNVNFALSGTATPGTDYNVTTSGTITFTNGSSNGVLTIPAGALGADLPIAVLGDALFEGAETINFNFAPGPYSRGLGAVMLIADTNVAPVVASFVSPSSAGSESTTNVSIPVMLSVTSAVPVTVDYAVSGATASGTATTVSAQSLPYWVRVVRTGFVMTFFESTDGTNWVQRGGPFTVSNLPTNTYYAGLVVASGSATTNIATLDNFSVSGLVAGGATGAVSAVNLGNAAGGTHAVAGGVFSFTNAGSGVLGGSAADNFRFVFLPVTNSSNCVVTARLASQGATAANTRVGVMFRADTNNQGAIYAAAMANGTGGFIAGYRTTLNGSSATQSAVTTQIMPMWFKLERTGNLFRTYSSKDGVAWTNLGATNQNIALGPKVVAGLAVSARSDGSLATATFDNVSLTPAAGTLRGREVGFVNLDGSESFSNGVWTVIASGNGIGGANDEGHLTGAEVSGDFTLVARVVSLGGGANNAQAGVMMRQDRTHYSRQMYAGFVNNGGIEQQYRAQSATTAFGTGVDYLLTPGTLTFAPGETDKSIMFAVVNDNTFEPNNLVTIVLTNANGAAVLSAAGIHGYTIIDDDAPFANPVAGFAASNSVAQEGVGAAGISVSLSASAPGPVSVDYAVTGGTATNGGVDFDLPAGTLNFAAGESVKVIPLTIANDAFIESSETVVVTLSNGVGLTLGSLTNHTLTIADDDLPVVTIVAIDPNATESGDPGQFSFTRTGPTTSNLVLSLTRSGSATSGADYAAIGTSFTILAGASSGTTNVVPLQDASNEGNETVILTLAANAAYTIGSPNSATVTIADDDRSTVTIVANTPNASETAGNPGQFTVSRTLPTNASLTVNLTISGTASNGVDYSSVASTVNFVAGESSKVINILPVDDGTTEGPEQVTISTASGSYNIGAAYFDNVTIADNDNPPVLFISSPSAQGPLIAGSNGLIVSAVVTDDGAPQPVTLQWSQAGGPGTATFETPAAASSAVTFSTNGTYVLRATATDGQFTVSDQVTVAVGSTIAAAQWITEDMAPTPARRGQGVIRDGVFTISGTGAGYAGATADTAHVMVRPVEGDSTLVARLNSVTNAAAPLAGLTMRGSLQRGATRAVLGFGPGVGLQFRTRLANGAADAAVTNAAVTLPLWLKLERNAASNLVTASFAPDVSGAPGAWTVIGAPASITMGARVNVGLTTAANSSSNIATAVFDNVMLTPAPVGPALIAEELNLSPAQAGSFSETNGIYTIAGSSTGVFYGWQFHGDMVVTVKHADATSGAGSAKSGIRIRESMDSGAYVQVGRIPQGAYSGYLWQSIAGGGSGGVPSFTGKTRWVRIIRKGNSVTAFHAPDVSGAPGTWAQIGQPQTVIMTTPVIVGFNVDNASGVGLNTATFSNLTILPLNRAPVVDAGTVAGNVTTSTPLDGSVTDDDFPAPPSLSATWSAVSSPGPVVFVNATNIDTTATVSAGGMYQLRLRASDGSAETFDDVSFNVIASGFAAWQATNFPGGSTNPIAAAGLDPDGDGSSNLAEYAFGTDPNVANVEPFTFSLTNISGQIYFRVSVPKNSNATDVQYAVEWAGPLSNGAAWSGGSLVTQQNTVTNLAVRDGTSIDALTNRAYRVNVTKP